MSQQLPSSSHFFHCIPVSTRAVIFMTMLLVSTSLIGSEPRDISVDPQHVVGAEKCSKCHQSEISTWHQTPHYQTFEQLHRKPEATAIAKRLGLSSIKRNDTCIRCHYTQQQSGRKVKPISGVSCESCHGAAEAWLESHADYGGPDVTREQESAAHKQQRRARAIAQGMRNPSNLYLVAQSCFNCHTAPDEKLVNVGGHNVGTLEFELVAYSQGKIRHNFVRSNGKQNEVSSPERLRVMFMVGLLTDLEYSLRATAKATELQLYGVTNAHRADRLRKELQGIQQALQDPLLQPAVDAATQVKLKLNNADKLFEAADTISLTAYNFAEQRDGSTLAVIDELLPQPNQYK